MWISDINTKLSIYTDYTQHLASKGAIILQKESKKFAQHDLQDKMEDVEVVWEDKI